MKLYLKSTNCIIMNKKSSFLIFFIFLSYDYTAFILKPINQYSYQSITINQLFKSQLINISRRIHIKIIDTLICFLHVIVRRFCTAPSTIYSRCIKILIYGQILRFSSSCFFSVEILHFFFAFSISREFFISC